MSDRLFVPLASEPFWRFAWAGKSVEVRQARGRWNRRNVREGRPVMLRRGYSTGDEIEGNVGRVAEAPTFDALPEWARVGAKVSPDQAVAWFDAGAPVLAFEVRVVKLTLPGMDADRITRTLPVQNGSDSGGGLS